MTGAQIAAQCLGSFRRLNGDTFGEPVQRLVARNGDSQMGVYVAGRSEWISICCSGQPGEEEAFGAVMEQGRADRIRLFCGEIPCSSEPAARPPAQGAATITARLPSGQILTGPMTATCFLVWAPGGSVRGARLTAARSDGSVVDTAAAPGRRRLSAGDAPDARTSSADRSRRIEGWIITHCPRARPVRTPYL